MGGMILTHAAKPMITLAICVCTHDTYHLIYQSIPPLSPVFLVHWLCTLSVDTPGLLAHDIIPEYP